MVKTNQNVSSFEIQPIPVVDFLEQIELANEITYFKSIPKKKLTFIEQEEILQMQIDFHPVKCTLFN